MNDVENQKLKKKIHTLSFMFFLTGFSSAVLYYLLYNSGLEWWKHAIVIVYISLAMLSATGLWLYKKWGRILGLIYSIISAGVVIAIIFRKASIFSKENEWAMPIILISGFSAYISIHFLNILTGSHEKVTAEIKAEIKKEEDDRKKGFMGQTKEIIKCVLMLLPVTPTIIALSKIWNIKFIKLMGMSIFVFIFVYLGTALWLAVLNDAIRKIMRKQQLKMRFNILGLLALIIIPIIGSSVMYNYYWKFPNLAELHTETLLIWIGKVLLNISYILTCFIVATGLIGWLPLYPLRKFIYPEDEKPTEPSLNQITPS